MRNKEIYRNEIKSYIIRAGMTMSEAVEILADEYGWSSSVPNLSDKLKRGRRKTCRIFSTYFQLIVVYCIYGNTA